MRPTPQAVFGAGASIIVLAAVVVGLWKVGAPGDARLRRLDDRRIAALEALSSAVSDFRRTHDSAPESLDVLARSQDDVSGYSIRDPETNAPYEYRRTGANSYELCARFSAVADEDVALRWRHGAGRRCFSLTVTAPSR